VESELAGSPAEAMGLSVNDEIVGIEGYRMGSDKISFSVETTKPGENLRLTIARGGKMMDLVGPIGERPVFEYRIQSVAAASEDQKKLFKRWMSTDWKAELKYPEYSKSPDRRPMFNYV